MKQARAGEENSPALLRCKPQDFTLLTWAYNEYLNVRL